MPRIQRLLCMEPTATGYSHYHTTIPWSVVARRSRGLEAIYSFVPLPLARGLTEYLPNPRWPRTYSIDNNHLFELLKGLLTDTVDLLDLFH